jgi:hypothetical protein
MAAVLASPALSTFDRDSKTEAQVAEGFEDSGAEILRTDDVSVRVIRDARSGKQVAVKRSELNKVSLLKSLRTPSCMNKLSLTLFRHLVAKVGRGAQTYRELGDGIVEGYMISWSCCVQPFWWHSMLQGLMRADGSFACGVVCALVQRAGIRNNQ